MSCDRPFQGPCKQTKAQSSLSSTRSRQAGVALITVLLVFAIAALISAKILVGKELDVQRTTGMVNRTQAYYYALAAEELAILVLKTDAEDDADNPPATDNLEEAWAQAAIPFEIDNIGAVLIQITDLNRFYNINNLIQHDGEVNLDELNRFRDLLVELDIEVSIADNLRDWLDSNDQVAGDLSEDDSYYEEKPGYRVANQRLSDVSELRLIRGFTAEVMKKLLPHISAIKVDGVVPLNLNTATDYALTTLQTTNGASKGRRSKSIGLGTAENIISDRADPFESVDGGSNGFVTRLKVAGYLPYPSDLNSGTSLLPTAGPRIASSVTSQYYEINIRANYAGSIAYLSTTVVKNGTGRSAKFIVLSRRENDNSSRFLASN